MIIENIDKSRCRCGHSKIVHHYKTIDDVEHFSGCHTLITDNAYDGRVLTYNVCSCKGYSETQ